MLEATVSVHHLAVWPFRVGHLQTPSQGAEGGESGVRGRGGEGGCGEGGDGFPSVPAKAQS
jgi:hypothetical protein